MAHPTPEQIEENRRLRQAARKGVRPAISGIDHHQEGQTMGRRPLTEAEKRAASERQKAHWDRCRMWAGLLSMSPADINYHWSSTIKPAIGDTTWDTPEPPTGVVVSVRYALSQRLLEDAAHRNNFAEWRYRQVTETIKRKRATPPTDIPDLEGQVKIMLWAIRTCGGVENATKAFEKALEFRRQLDE